ncbi:MAG: hypothetical protein ACRD44_09190 [Bryobacteraceae bacterium]
MTVRAHRRDFLTAAAGLAVASPAAARASQLGARPLTETEKFARLASNTWPIRSLFRARAGRESPRSAEMKKKFGEIMLDFPVFTKETFPGVTRTDLFSGLFGDVQDESSQR